MLASIDFNTSWSVVHMILIKEFSHLTTPAHAYVYFDSLQQKTGEILKIYNYRYSFYHNLVTGMSAEASTDPARWLKYLANI